jgi:hypothetical protein
MDSTVQPFDKRRMARSLKLGLLIVAGAAGLLPAARGLHGQASVSNEGPLDIRLVGVCPDGGDELYDADGRQLQATLPPLGIEDDTWHQDDQRRDFVFQVPAVREPLLFLPFQCLYPAGADYYQGVRTTDELDRAEGDSRLVVSSTFGRTYHRSQPGSLTLRSPIDKIDLMLQYFYGPRREALCTFTGPFQVGRTVAADAGRPYRLTPEPARAMKQSQVKFHFVTGRPFSGDASVLFYDQKGRRHYAGPSGFGRSGRGGADLTYDVEALPWDEVAAVTVGEKPYAITFRNVTVTYPGRPPRTYAASWDRMAARLDLTDLSLESLMRYDFRSVSEAVSVVDIVRNSSQMTKVLRALEPGRHQAGLAALDEAARDKIRRAATRWLQSPSMMGRAYGAQVGLLGGCREFVGPAFALLQYQHPTNRDMTRTVRNIGLTGLTYWYTDHRPAEDLERWKRLVREGDSGAAWSGLLRRCLVSPGRPVDTQVLWELAQEDPPWAWWPALKVLLEREGPQLRGYSTWPEKMKLRFLLVNRAEQRDRTKLLPQARLLLAGLFTPQTLRMCREIATDLHTALTACLDRKEATAVAMDFLRAALQPATRRQFEAEYGSDSALSTMVAWLLRDLNAWYGLNLGGLGVFQPGQVNTGLQGPGQAAKAAAAALEWYQATGGAPPAEPVLEARVVDRDARSIPGATITLRQTRPIFDEAGPRRPTTAETRALQTDADGRVVFRNLKAGGGCEFDIQAERFVPRKHLRLDRLPDGRFQIAADAGDNVIVLDRAAALSGRVIGADGRPLVRVWVQVLSYGTHAYGELTSVQTDAQGRFTAGAVPAGYQLVRCRSEGPSAAPGTFGRMAVQVVRVEEGEAAADVTLDLRATTATLEVLLVGSAERPITISLAAALPFAEPKYVHVMSFSVVESQAWQRFPHLPPLEGCLETFGSRRLPPVPLRLVAGRITRCRIGPKDIEIDTPVRPDEQRTGNGLKEEGSSTGALVP